MVKRWGEVRLVWLVCVVSMLVIGGCSEKVVVDNGVVVSDEVVKNAAQVLYGSERVLSAVPRVLIEGHKVGLVPDEVLVRFSEEVSPRIEEGLRVGGKVLREYSSVRSEENGVRLEQALRVVRLLVDEAIVLMEAYQR